MYPLIQDALLEKVRDCQRISEKAGIQLMWPPKNQTQVEKDFWRPDREGCRFAMFVHTSAFGLFDWNSAPS